MKRQRALTAIFLSLLVPFSVSTGKSSAEEKVKAAETKIGDIGIHLYSNKTIKSLDKDSTAAKARLLPGDRVLSVDGIPASSLTTDEMTKRFSGPEKSVAVLQIERAGKRYFCKIMRLAAGTVIGEIPSKSSTDYSKITTPIIEISRKSALSEGIRQDVLEGLAQIPKSIRDDMSNWGLKVKIVPSIVDDDRNLVQERPRGYTHGGGYDNCPGMYSNKVIYIPERVAWKNSPMKPNYQVSGTILHEMGHAFDHFRHASTAAEFESVYQGDAVKIPGEGRRRWEYYLQADGGGQSECFAELFAYYVAQKKNRSQGIDAAFPKTYSYMTHLIGPLK
ncbi:MAG: hypothetical protein SFY67_15155 [Candidatus Melainabacteria bacterium]|nr:hypothetical protein [Candidatus Melainabacteria bacterium]